jgi:DNA-binding beta-propeller fold protein YncE
MSLFIRSCFVLVLLLATTSDGFAQCTLPCGTFLTKWGSEGSGDGQFQYPAGIAVDGSGNVLVADSGNHRIQKFSNTGTFVTTWGSQGAGDGQFYYPRGVAVDASGNIYVADSGNQRVQKFTSDGTFLAKWGSYGSGNGQFTFGPFGVAVDGSGHVFTTDWDQMCYPFWGCETISPRVQKFSDTGTFLTAWGSAGDGDGQFNTLYGVAVDGSGNVYVADWGNARVQKFTNTGSFILELGNYGSGDGQFTFPFAVAVDSHGHVFVTDTDNNITDTPARVEKFTNTGTFLTTWGSPGSGDGQFGNGGPPGVAVDGSGHVFVADGLNNRIQKFACQ